jgi:hypothetical protein
MPWPHENDPGSNNLRIDEAESGKRNDHIQAKQNVPLLLHLSVNKTQASCRVIN